MFYSSHTIKFPLLPFLWHLSFPHWPSSLTPLCCLFWCLLNTHTRYHQIRAIPNLCSSFHQSTQTHLCLQRFLSRALLQRPPLWNVCSHCWLWNHFSVLPQRLSSLWSVPLFSFTSHRGQLLTQLPWEKPFRSALPWLRQYSNTLSHFSLGFHPLSWQATRLLGHVFPVLFIPNRSIHFRSLSKAAVSNSSLPLFSTVPICSLLCLSDLSQLPKCPTGWFQSLPSLSSPAPLFYSQLSFLTPFFPQFSAELFPASYSQLQRTTLSSATSLLLSVSPQTCQGLLSLFFTTELSARWITTCPHLYSIRKQKFQSRTPFPRIGSKTTLIIL